MGEAKRRRELGLLPKTIRCPVRACRSKRVSMATRKSEFAALVAKAWGGTAPTTLLVCGDCQAFWEPYPPGWTTDSVERAQRLGPCDTCAYRATSPETRDPEQRAKLHALARSTNGQGMPSGWFACHKGIPMFLRNGTIEFDFVAAGIDPVHQTCAGYLRVLWASNGAAKRRAEGWGQDAP